MPTPTMPTWLSRRRFPKKTLIAGAVVLALYGAVGFLVLPGIVKNALIETVSDLTDRTPTVGDVSTNPFALSVTVRDFVLTSRFGDSLVTFRELYVNAELISLVFQEYTFSEIRLEAPSLRVVIRPDGVVNVLVPFAGPDQDTAVVDDEPVIVHIGELVVADGALVYEDLQRTSPFVARLDSLDLSLREFTTSPNEEGIYQFDATTDRDEKIGWRGSISVAPLRSAGKLGLAGFTGRTVWEFLRDQLNFEITDGRIGFEADYVLDLSTDPILFRITNGHGTLESIAVRGLGAEEDEIAVPLVAISGVEADVTAQRLTVGLIETSGGTIRGTLRPDSTFSLAALSETPAQALASQAESVPWKVVVRKVLAQQYAISFTDSTTTPAARLELAPLRVAVENFASGLPATASVDLRTGLNRAGSLAVTGTLVPESFSFALDVSVDRIALSPFQPYVNTYASLDIRSGTLSMNGRLRQRMRSGSPVVEFAGDLWSETFHATDRLRDEDFLRWARLEVNRLVYTSRPALLSVQEVAVREPYLRAIVNEDNTTNIQDILNAGADSLDAADTPEAGADTMRIRIPAVRIESGTMNLSDLSLTPNFVVTIHDLAGTIQGLSSEELSRAQIDVRGLVDRYAPATITGDINPLTDQAYTDIRLNFQGIELTTFSPYSGKFAGYRIDKGKLTLKLRYVLNQRFLKGENRIVLDQLTLGEKVESPDATSLPVKLAIAILKDANGVIDLDIPVEGSLDDPEFSVFPLVVKAFVNLFTKIVTAPFALLGALFGGGEDLSFVAFEAGVDSLSVVERAKLDSLGHALKERPQLRLDVRGAAAAPLDREAMARAALSKQLRLGKGWSDSTLTGDERERVLEFYERSTGEDPAEIVAETEKGGGLSSSDRERLIASRALRRLLDSHVVPDAELENLARGRAAAIKDHLVLVAGLEEQRVYLLDSDLRASPHDGGVRIELSLNAP